MNNYFISQKSGDAMLIPDRKVNAFAAILRPFKGDKNSIPLALVNEIKP